MVRYEWTSEMSLRKTYVMQNMCSLGDIWHLPKAAQVMWTRVKNIFQSVRPKIYSECAFGLRFCYWLTKRHYSRSDGALGRFGTKAVVLSSALRARRWTGFAFGGLVFFVMAAAIASGLIRQKRQAREQQLHRPPPHRRRKSPNKNKGLCNGNLVDIFSKVRIFGLKKRRLRRQGVGNYSKRTVTLHLAYMLTLNLILSSVKLVTLCYAPLS